MTQVEVNIGLQKSLKKFHNVLNCMERLGKISAITDSMLTGPANINMKNVNLYVL